MNDAFLISRLNRVRRRFRWLALWRSLSAAWAITTLVTLVVVAIGRTPPAPTIVVLSLLGIGIAALLFRFQIHRTRSDQWIAARVERAFPELNGVLLTAVEEPADRGGTSDFLRHKVERDAIARSQEQDWRRVVPIHRFVFIQLVHASALGCLLFAMFGLNRSKPVPARPGLVVLADGVSVTPGDTQLEKGDPLVVLATFARTVPAHASLVVREPGRQPRTVNLTKNLADPVFGGSVTDATNSFSYRIDYGSGSTREFQVNVFEHPRLVRADAQLTFPEYTKLKPRRIEDTRRLSAVESTQVELTLQLNKPVISAKLIARDAAKTVLPLAVDATSPTARLSAWVPKVSGTYDLQLQDSDGRANKGGAPFVVEVQPNRPPEVKLASPRGDVRPSALEEISFDGTVWDDFGTIALGLEYTIAGGEAKSLELGRDIPSGEKKAFHYTLSLEALGAKPDDLVSWHVWADDIGPDGNRRRTNGDLYFAEVRPFDEIFRESQGVQSADDQNQSGGGNATRRLSELQKQIINATWKLQRDGARSGYPKDLEVVHDSQAQARDQANETAEQVRSPTQRALWQTALNEMEKALKGLDDASTDPAKLASALAPEQSAYQTLLKLQARETAVTRGQRGRSGANGGQSPNQRQIDQLDLQQAENRYETRRDAQAPQDPQRRDQLAVMNRLQDLARRQEDLNQRMKELQTALQEARTDAQREELQRRLKRLEDEQRQMLADADDARQRMDNAANQADMSQQRQQLDQAREDLQRAADAAGQGSVSQALASGTRAQRQLQQTRDELRQQSSSRFADDLRDMRSEARELSRQQEQLEQRMAGTEQATEPRKSLSNASDQPDVGADVAKQRDRWNQLLDRARQVSEQSESSEPLVSKQLYDSVRKVTQDDEASVSRLRGDLLGRGELTLDMRDRFEKAERDAASGKALDLAKEMLREGNTQAANESVKRAGKEVDDLRQGIEHAAESVLGDDAEQLKLARSELDQLANQVRQEMNRASGTETGAEKGPPGAPSQPQGDRIAQSANPGEGRSASSNQTDRSDRSDPSDTSSKAGSSGQPGNLNGSRRTADARNRRNGLDQLFNGDNTNGGGGGDARAVDGPLTGEDFGTWTNRLRDVEQLVDTPELRDALAKARERMRGIRRDYTQAHQKPDWTVVQLQVVKPLVEVRDRLTEELARRDNRNPLVPIDHDPVPNRFAESVRRYYEELGKGSATAPPP